MKKYRQKGIIQLLILVLVAIIALSYFGIDLQEVFAKPLIKKNLIFTWNKSKEVWNEYIYGPISNLVDKNKDDSSEASSDGGSIQK